MIRASCLEVNGDISSLITSIAALEAAASLKISFPIVETLA
jgi:hypothetical protein